MSQFKKRFHLDKTQKLKPHENAPFQRMPFKIVEIMTFLARSPKVITPLQN
jgi:hypothetical protein